MKPVFRLHSSINIRIFMLCFFITFVFLSSACTATVPPKKNMPVWPNNDIAQRDFYGEQMFVENDKGKWRAWVLSLSDNDKGEVLDFFSGKKQQVKLKYSEDGRVAPEFVDSAGRLHILTMDLDLHFDDPRPGGSVGDVGFSDDELYLGKRSVYCSPELIIVTGTDLHNPKQLRRWRKIPLYREPSSISCPNGRWRSLIGTSLDLGDGTFLATTEFWVFRLRMSDLSPVGSAPRLHVVDAEIIEAIIKGAQGKTITDHHAYLTTALRLPLLESVPVKHKEKLP